MTLIFASELSFILQAFNTIILISVGNILCCERSSIVQILVRAVVEYLVLMLINVSVEVGLTRFAGRVFLATFVLVHVLKVRLF